jgi:hypothetical protein
MSEEIQIFNATQESKGIVDKVFMGKEDGFLIEI